MQSSLINFNSPPFLMHKAMDWYSWLAKSKLDESLIYEYSLLFSDNELEEEDIVHLDHEVLKSMGISIAKHRLEILKLAKIERTKPPRPVAKLLAAMEKTKKSVSKYIQDLVHRNNSAMVIVPKISYGGQWRRALMKKNNELVIMKQGRLMLTNGEMKISGPLTSSQTTSPVVHNGGEGDGDAQEIKWDFMFQDLRPT